MDQRARARLQLAYPDNIYSIPHRCIMYFQTRDREITCSIQLPVPLRIEEQYTMDITAESLGAFGGLFESAMAGMDGGIDNLSMDGVANALRRILGDISDSAMLALLDYGGGIAENASNMLRLRDVRGNAIFGRQQFMRSALSGAGVQINPYTTSIFQGVNIRIHDLVWKITPQSRSETVAIEKIIEAIRVRMHPTPSNSNLFMKTPEELVFRYVGAAERQFEFPIAPCYVLGMKVDRTGTNTPTFFAETGAPVSYVLSMSCIELLPLIRDPHDPNRLVTNQVNLRAEGDGQ